MRGFVPDSWKIIPTLAAVAVLGLTGCAEAPTRPVAVEQTGPTQDQLINQNLLRQASVAIEKREFVNARQLLQQLRLRQLPTRDRIETLILSGIVEISTDNGSAAMGHLNDLGRLRNQATPEQDSRISLLNAAWYEQRGEYLAAARERVFVASTLSNAVWTANHNSIWKDLQQLPVEELGDRARQNQGTILGQWLELAALARSATGTLGSRLQAIESWKSRYPNHPAAIEMPGDLAALKPMEVPRRVAVVLPLSGDLARSGQAIRDGMLAAYYDALNLGEAVPELLIYDSLAGNIDAIYADAVMQGANWMIGPVSKQEVQNLESRTDLPLPTLALNYGDLIATPEETTLPANLYEMGLAPEDEAIQIAERAWADGHRRALVLVPEAPWGERIYRAFQEQWLALGGEISETRYYPNRNDYNPDVKALLNTDDSEKRAQTMRQLLQQRPEFEPRRRQDADWLFLVAPPQQARQINPTLAFNFASDLPVYATSHLYSGIPDINRDKDLNGIRFCDLPWLLSKPALYEQVELSTEGGQGRYVRLYALGVDALRTLPALGMMQAFPNSQIAGVTGLLMLDQNRRIRRHAECARFDNGTPVRLADGQ